MITPGPVCKVLSDGAGRVWQHGGNELNFHQKEEWDTASMATYRRQSIDWFTTLIYTGIAAAFALSCWAFKCGHGMTLLGGWVFVGGLFLATDANCRGPLRGTVTGLASIAAIIIGVALMGAGK